MKKIIIAMAAIAAAFTMASCNKEQPVSPNEKPTVGKSVITASIENDLTKTSLEGNDTDGYEVYWSEGDDLFVADAFFKCWAAKYTLDNECADSPKGTFSWHTGDMFIPVDESYQEGPAFEKDKLYMALYPFALTGEEVGEYLIWKTEQTYNDTYRYIPMYSELECTEAGTADFKFKNLGGLLRLTVKGSATICSIKIEAAEAMSGSFILSLDADDVTMAVAGVGRDAANYIILDCGEDGVGLTESGTDFYISIPCRCICEDDQIVGLEGYSDVTITLTDTEGKVCEKKLKSNNLVIERSKITTASFTASEFNPIDPLADVEIPTAAKWNEFATAYNKGTVQDCSISITGNLDFTDRDVVTLGSYESEKKFSGTINGNNHVVKNLHSSKPLIGNIGTDGVVTDLTIDETCSYTVTCGLEDSVNGYFGYFGPFVSNLEGQLVNCVNNASITLDKYNALENDNDIYIGGLIGCIKGGIADGCVNYGTITFNETYTSAHNAHAGGIVGYVSSAAGTVTSCTNHGEIINHTCWAKQVHMGGIVGYGLATVTYCTNDADLSTDIDDRPTDDACEHISMAGIAGCQAGGKITDCTNSGNILSKSKVKHQYIGGICGIVSGTVTNKDNTSSGNIHSTSTVRNPMIGGLYGRVDEDNTFEFSGKPFTGQINLDNFESGDNTFVYVGGLIGICRDGAKLLGIGAAPVAGPDSVVIGNTVSKSWRLSVGGIVGAIGETWSALKDTLDLGDGGDLYVETYQKVTEGAQAVISNFRNVGAVVQHGGSAIKPGSRIGSFGGIIGGMLCGGTIENCINDGSVQYLEFTSLTNSNGYPVHVGGIVGRADGSTSVIKGCSNSGMIYNQLCNNNNFDIRGHRGSNTVGGIVGSFGYKPLSTATLTIEDCHSTGEMYAYRGPAGGIIGYANHTTVKSSTFKDNTIKHGSPVGGIIGAGENCTVEGCTVKVSELKGISGGATSGDCGGIIGDARNCSANGCRFFGNISGDKLMGGIFGRNDANCTIGTKASCTYGGKVGDAEIDDMFYILYYAGNSELIDVDITTQIGWWNGTL